jgi:hypothetical protein
LCSTAAHEKEIVVAFEKKMKNLAGWRGIVGQGLQQKDIVHAFIIKHFVWIVGPQFYMAIGFVYYIIQTSVRFIQKTPQKIISTSCPVLAYVVVYINKASRNANLNLCRGHSAMAVVLLNAFIRLCSPATIHLCTKTKK